MMISIILCCGLACLRTAGLTCMLTDHFLLKELVSDLLQFLRGLWRQLTSFVVQVATTLFVVLV